MKKKTEFVPMLFTNMKSYSKNQFIKDVVAGVIVAIIALPLSIALALASGVGPENGIYTAIIAGFLIAFLGGSNVQIAGPTAAFATIVAGIVAEHGIDGLVLATLIAGVLLILMGVFKLGALIKFIPYTITTGFTAGIAVTIVIGQITNFLGIHIPKGTPTIETMEKLSAIAGNIGGTNWDAVIVGVISLAILIGWNYVPKIGSLVPGSLIAVLAGIFMVKGIGLQADTIGDLYTISNSLPAFHMPTVTFGAVRAVLANGFTIAVLAAIESLLSCVVADSMVNAHHRSNQELIAQGVGNIGSALFGGIPATGAIARTAANIKNGGRTPIAGIVHSIVLVIILVVLMPYAALIPMSTIAAILFQVAYNMCGWRTFKHLCKTAPKSDIMVLIVTFVLTVVFDLVVAIGVGMVLACVMFMKRMADESEVRGWKYFDPAEDEDNIELKQVPTFVRVYEISGPMFFGAADRLLDITLKDFTKVLIIRMRSVPALDATAMHSLESLHEKCKKKGVTIIFSHVNEQPMRTMKKTGFVELIGNKNFCEHIDDAILRAKEIMKAYVLDNEI